MAVEQPYFSKLASGIETTQPTVFVRKESYRSKVTLRLWYIDLSVVSSNIMALEHLLFSPCSTAVHDRSRRRQGQRSRRRCRRRRPFLRDFPKMFDHLLCVSVCVCVNDAINYYLFVRKCVNSQIRRTYELTYARQLILTGKTDSAYICTVYRAP